MVEELRRQSPDAEFFGCTGPRLRAAGVETVVDAASLAVVGLLEVVRHIPRIYGEYRKAGRGRRGNAGPIWPSSPIRRIFTSGWPGGCIEQGMPVVYLVAPQAWAWRKGRVKSMRRTLRRLLLHFSV